MPLSQLSQFILIQLKGNSGIIEFLRALVFLRLVKADNAHFKHEVPFLDKQLQGLKPRRIT